METKNTNKGNIAHIVIYVTTDYGMFKKIKGNRAVDKPNLKKIIASAKEKYIPTPAIVNNKMEIIDGQHRLEMCKALNLPYYYEIRDGYELSDVHRYNKNSKNWGANDFLDGYCDLGKQDYIEYRLFRNKFKLGSTESMFILSGGSGNGSSVEKFRQGDFKIKSLQDAYDFAKNIYKVEPYYKGFLRRSFVFAIYYLVNNTAFDIDIFIEKLKYQSTRMVDCTNTTQYINLVKDIYNYKSRNKI